MVTLYTVRCLSIYRYTIFSVFSDALDHKFIGCPISIENAKYSRNALVFNVCFVLGPNVDTIRYEGVVKKLAGYMTSLEVICKIFNITTARAHWLRGLWFCTDGVDLLLDSMIVSAREK